jgi:hypothetical protein
MEEEEVQSILIPCSVDLFQPFSLSGSLYCNHPFLLLSGSPRLYLVISGLSPLYKVVKAAPLGYPPFAAHAPIRNRRRFCDIVPLLASFTPPTSSTTSSLNLPSSRQQQNHHHQRVSTTRVSPTPIHQSHSLLSLPILPPHLRRDPPASPLSPTQPRFYLRSRRNLQSWKVSTTPSPPPRCAHSAAHPSPSRAHSLISSPFHRRSRRSRH